MCGVGFDHDDCGDNQRLRVVAVRVGGVGIGSQGGGGWMGGLVGSEVDGWV